jgi:hypothetical protein
MIGKYKLVAPTLILSTALAAPSYSVAEEVAMSCEWVAYARQTDSFVFDLDKMSVYWVEEDQTLKTRINEGRITFNGNHNRINLGNGEYSKDLPVTFIINRVTGEVTVVNGNQASGNYNHQCVVRQRLL